jgi:hypothetical protein
MVSHLALFLGQSNQMNFGTLGLPFPGGWTPDPLIQIWNGFKITPGFETYNPGVNSGGMDNFAVWGPEAEFAREWRASLVPPFTNDVLYIYKQALGGTGDGVAAKPPGILDWSPDSIDKVDTAFKQYPRMVTNLTAAANWIINNVGPLSFEVISYVGCETDTVLQADADACQLNLANLISSIRLPFAALDRPPCILSRPFPNSTQGAFLNTVRTAIETVGSYPNNAWVNMDDLTESGPHPGHLDPASVVTLGGRVFTSFATFPKPALPDTARTTPF